MLSGSAVQLAVEVVQTDILYVSDLDNFTHVLELSTFTLDLKVTCRWARVCMAKLKFKESASKRAKYTRSYSNRSIIGIWKWNESNLTW